MATPEEMNEAAERAKEDLLKLPEEQRKAVAEWWHSHYLSAGHKRLARVLLGTLDD